MPLFEVAIVQHPTKKEKDEGGQEKLLFGPKAVIANDDQSAAVAATLKAKIEEADFGRCQVLVRNFS